MTSNTMGIFTHILPVLLASVVLSAQVKPKQATQWIRVEPGTVKIIGERSTFRRPYRTDNWDFVTDEEDYLNLDCQAILPCNKDSYIKVFDELSFLIGTHCSTSLTKKENIPKYSSKGSLTLEFYSGETNQARYTCKITSSKTPITTTTTPRPTTTVPPCNCGTLGGPRVAGGSPVIKGAIPWQVAIGKMVASKFNAFCGGTVISAAHVITAAHCVKANDTTIKVFMGDVDLTSTTASIISLARVEPHDSYNPNTFENDIAFLAFTKLVTFNNFMYPICLPRKFESESFTGKRLLVSGWGRESGASSNFSTLLQAATVKGVSNSDCGQSYTPATITNNMLCANATGNYTTPGDSGGPLTYTEASVSYLVGVVSFGKGSSFPGVYTRVTSYMKWVDEKIGFVLCSK